MEPEKEIVNIEFGEVSMCLPRSIEAIRIARKLLDMLEEYLEDACKSQGCHQNESKPIELIPLQENKAESLPERKDGAIALIPQELPSFKSELIPKFEYEKKAEKSYDKLFFFEHEDGRVMLSYMSCKLYTTKAAVLGIPFPVPYGYVPLKGLSMNHRTAVRAYRKYLNGMDAGYPVLPEEKESADATETETERKKKLKEAAEKNAARWKDGKREMSARTKELRDGVVAKMVLGI